MNYTDNYNLRKPELTDPVDIDDLNYNADEIDSLLKDLADGLDYKVDKKVGNAKVMPQISYTIDEKIHRRLYYG